MKRAVLSFINGMFWVVILYLFLLSIGATVIQVKELIRDVKDLIR